MLKSAVAALALIAAAGPALALPPAPTHASANALATAPLTVNSTLRDLVLDPRTRPVIEKHMPGFAERLESEPELAEMFGGVTLAGLAHDPHVRGMTDEALATLAAELAAAQVSPT